MKKIFHFVILLVMAIVALMGCAKKTYVEHTGFSDFGIEGNAYIRQEYVLHYYGPDVNAFLGGGIYPLFVMLYECEFTRTDIKIPEPVVKISSTSFGESETISAGSTISFYVDCNTSLHLSVTIGFRFGDTVLWNGKIDNLNKK